MFPPPIKKRYLPLSGRPSDETTTAALRAIGLEKLHQTGRVFEWSVMGILHSIQNWAENAPPPRQKLWTELVDQADTKQAKVDRSAISI